MYMLVLQTFLLMMAAFLLGATIACLVKRTIYRVGADDVAGDALHIEVPPAVQRSEPVARAVASPPVTVTREEAERFERALKGDVADVAAAATTVRQAGPVIEVQPLPVPPAALESPPPPAAEFDSARFTGSAANDAMAEDHRTYNEIAVASHDGSMLPPPVVDEVVLPPPQMPSPAPAALPVPPVDIPSYARPGDAPNDPDPNYIAEALASGATYQPQPEEAESDFDLPAPGNPDDFTVPPDGETYASVALGGGSSAPAPTQAPAPAPAAEVSAPAVIETKTTHATTALAAAAGIAAQRAATDAGADDLTRIKGIDEVLAARLNYAGVTRFDQIAAWSVDDVRRMSQTIGFFGRIEDEYWIDQARLLVAGGTSAATTAEPPKRVTSAAAADMATAAAAAAAAAMVASTQRAAPAADAPLRPAKLADAIRENAAQAEDAESSDTSASDEPLESAGSSLTGLRSVRSESLLGGEDADLIRGNLDDLKRIRGIGVLIEKKLNSLGITSYEQVANWSVADIERISEILDFKGRIERENWIEQARILASGGQTEFSRRVDRGEV